MKTVLVDAVGTLVTDGKIYQPMFELLETFSNKKIILSNANDEQMVPFGLINLPYDLFTLKHNPDKTDPKFFVTMLTHFGLSKDDVIYFEHDEDAVKSALSVGIKTYYYDSNTKDLEALKNFLTENL